MRSKKPTLTQLAEKQIRRLERATKRAIERGYVFDLPFRRTKTGKEKTRYTAREVEKLKLLHLKDLYKYSTRGGVAGEKARAEERRWQAKIASQTRWRKEAEKRRIQDEIESKRIWKDIWSETKTSYVSITPKVIDDFLDRKNWVGYWSDYNYNNIANFIQRAREELGDNEVAQTLQELKNDGAIQELQKYHKKDELWIAIETFKDAFRQKSENLGFLKIDYDKQDEDYPERDMTDDEYDEFFG